MGILNENLTTAKSLLAQTRGSVRELADERSKVQGKLDIAERNQYSTAQQHRDRLTQLDAEFAVAVHEKERAEKILMAAELALYNVRGKRNAERERDMMSFLGCPQDLKMRVQWGDWTAYGSILCELQLLEMTPDNEIVMEKYFDREGVEQTIEKSRFGYSADVNGPRQDWRGEWSEATANWGSLGSLKVADAKTMLRVHGYAVSIAEYMNDHRAQWVEEDRAD
jgi:hypothetical protein